MGRASLFWKDLSRKSVVHVLLTSVSQEGGRRNVKFIKSALVLTSLMGAGTEELWNKNSGAPWERQWLRC